MFSNKSMLDQYAAISYLKYFGFKHDLELDIGFAPLRTVSHIAISFRRDGTIVSYNKRYHDGKRTIIRNSAELSRINPRADIFNHVGLFRVYMPESEAYLTMATWARNLDKVGFIIKPIQNKYEIWHIITTKERSI